ncbi:hypothetical protein [Arthrobacter sp. NPDC090010]|uniref:hypothetical protein n=1 Tax=Arthrobacter sp. NPDC090010 TaxID=3363942 RepID=UPI00381B7357
MPKLFGLHNLLGALAALLVGILLGLLRVNGLIQVLFVVVAYLAGSFLAHDMLRKRRAAQEPGVSAAEEPDEPRFHHFDTRAMERIEEERRLSERRENHPPEPERQPEPKPEPEEPPVQHFDSRAMQRIEDERRASGRRDD